MIPPHDEAETNLAILEQAGVATSMKVSPDVAETIVGLRNFLNDRALPDHALEQAARISGRVLTDGAEAAAAVIRAALG